jgi:hypothetical protein
MQLPQPSRLLRSGWRREFAESSPAPALAAVAKWWVLYPSGGRWIPTVDERENRADPPANEARTAVARDTESFFFFGDEGSDRERSYSPPPPLYSWGGAWARRPVTTTVKKFCSASSPSEPAARAAVAKWWVLYPSGGPEPRRWTRGQAGPTRPQMRLVPPWRGIPRVSSFLVTRALIVNVVIRHHRRFILRGG